MFRVTDFQCDSKFVHFALLYARLRLLILRLRVDDSQSGCKGLIRTCLFGIHWNAFDVIVSLRFEAYVSMPSFGTTPVKRRSFRSQKVIVALLIGPTMTREGFDLWF